MRASEFIVETQELDEIERLNPNEFRGGKSALRDRIFGKQIKPLPGGSRLLYSTSEGRFGGMDIKLWDPKGKDFISQPTSAPGQLIGKLTTSHANNFPIPKALQVDAITVDEDYRGQGIATSLYGIVLTILKRPLLAGESQTPGGRRNWVSLSNISGVDMKGYFCLDIDDLTEMPTLVPNRRKSIGQNEWDRKMSDSHNTKVEKNIDTIMGKLGGQHIGRTRGGLEFFSFDVRPNTTGTELESAVKTKLSKIYENFNSQTGLYAIWTGQ